MSDEEETTNTGEEGTEKGAGQEIPVASVATEATGTPKPEKDTELKVVIILKANKVLLGVQSPDCDPVYRTMEGDLAGVLQVVPTLVAEAKLKWTASPRYPKADLPKPVVPAATTSTASKPAAKTAQPKFF